MHTLAQLIFQDEIDIVKSRFSRHQKDIFVSNITCNSNEILQQRDGQYQIFIAKKGAHVDGNDFVDRVLELDNTAIIVSENSHNEPENFIQVNDINKTTALLAKKFYNSPDEHLKIVSITGTNGKSTIGFLLRHLLSTKERTGLIGTIEYDLGAEKFHGSNTTPDSIELYRNLSIALRNGCKNIVIEVSSHALELKRAYGMRSFAAIFTNLTQDHLDFHKTLENYFTAKTKLFSGENGCIPKHSIINIDDAHGKILIEKLPKTTKVCTYGFSHSSEFHIENVSQTNTSCSEFSVKHNGRKTSIFTHLIGNFNISNVSAATCVAKLYGLTDKEISESLKTFYGVPGRLERIKHTNGATIFVDYAHTPAALENVLLMLNNLPHNRLITVFGCGGNRDRSKRAPMTTIVNKLSDFTIATSDNPRNEPIAEIFKDMEDGIVAVNKIKFVENRRSAIELAIEMSKKDDIILIAGKGHETYQQIGEKFFDFDDRVVVTETLKKFQNGS